MPPKFAHAEAGATLAESIRDQVKDMGLAAKLVAGTVAEIDLGDARKKTPDYYWRLKGKDVRPTMVLEVEMTTSAGKTRGDAKIWLSRPDFQPVFLTVQVVPPAQKVVVTRWKRVKNSMKQCGLVSAQVLGDSLELRGETIKIPVAALLGQAQADQDQRVLKIDRRHAEAILHNLRDHKEFRAADKRALSPGHRKPPT
ncbi:hypothetical protein KEM56_006888 [Ascosphaera pollenicola]|nr:hypothetical protein KEM56_006888 [Ascosphaera pollenicola]